jgi:hypothetical protein
MAYSGSQSSVGGSSNSDGVVDVDAKTGVVNAKLQIQYY